MGLADTRISVWALGAGAALTVVAIGAVVWFAIPGPDAVHRFVSPSGKVALELGEMCREGSCRRVAISEEVAPDGRRRRLGCELDLSEARPVLLDAHPLWAADERSVEVVYAGADGKGGTFMLDLGKDCTHIGE